MNKFKSGLAKTAKFLRKNIYYVLIVVAVAAIGTMVAVALTRDNAGYDVPTVQTPIDNPVIEPDDSGNPVDNPVVEPTPVIFINPVASGAVSASYSDTELVFSKTLEQWSTHLAVDFMADEGSAVSAVYGGTVTNIVNDDVTGYTVTLSHGDGLSTRYCGMNANVAVEIGQEISQGAKIGEVSNNMLFESADGPHLHFETYKDGKLINPAEYFVTDEK